MPEYFFFQLKEVAWLIPASRQISATVELILTLLDERFLRVRELRCLDRFRSSPRQEMVQKL